MEVCVLAKTLRGPLQRTCGPRTAHGAALESLAAPLAPEKCVSTPNLRARSAALSKLIVRTEQNNFAGGGTVAGLVLWAPVAARRAEVRTSGPNLVPPRSMWYKCFGRRKLTTICCTGCWGLAKTPRGRSAALSGELGGGSRTFRLQRPCLSSKVPLFKTWEQLKGSGLDPPEKSQIFLDE